MVEHPSDEEIRQKVVDVQTEAAMTLLQEPAQTTDPPATYGSPAESSGDAFGTYAGRFAYIEDLFEMFLTPVPSEFEELENDLLARGATFDRFGVAQVGHGLFKERFPEMDRLQSAVNLSSSRTLINFSNHFLDDLELIWLNHASITKTLGLAAQGIARIYARARYDLITIADLTIALLKEARDHGAFDGKSEELGVISDVSGLLGLLATPIKPLSIGLEGVSLTTQVLSYTTDNKENTGELSDGTYTISGTDAVAIVASMATATRTLEDDVGTALTAVKNGLGSFNSALDNDRYRKFFITPDVHFPTTADV